MIPTAQSMTTGAARSSLSIPTIDVQHLRANDTLARRACGRAIDRACRDVGFFYIVGHDLDRDLIKETFAVAREFFGRPMSKGAGNPARHMPVTSGDYVRERLTGAYAKP